MGEERRQMFELVGKPPPSLSKLVTIRYRRSRKMSDKASPEKGGLSWGATFLGEQIDPEWVRLTIEDEYFFLPFKISGVVVIKPYNGEQEQPSSSQARSSSPTMQCEKPEGLVISTATPRSSDVQVQSQLPGETAGRIVRIWLLAPDDGRVYMVCGTIIKSAAWTHGEGEVLEKDGSNQFSAHVQNDNAHNLTMYTTKFTLDTDAVREFKFYSKTYSLSPAFTWEDDVKCNRTFSPNIEPDVVYARYGKRGLDQLTDLLVFVLCSKRVLQAEDACVLLDRAENDIEAVERSFKPQQVPSREREDAVMKATCRIQGLSLTDEQRRRALSPLILWAYSLQARRVSPGIADIDITTLHKQLLLEIAARWSKELVSHPALQDMACRVLTKAVLLEAFGPRKEVSPFWRCAVANAFIHYGGQWNRDCLLVARSCPRESVPITVELVADAWVSHRSMDCFDFVLRLFLTQEASLEPAAQRVAEVILIFAQDAILKNRCIFVFLQEVLACIGANCEREQLLWPNLHSVLTYLISLANIAAECQDEDCFCPLVRQLKEGWHKSKLRSFLPDVYERNHCIGTKLLAAAVTEDSSTMPDNRDGSLAWLSLAAVDSMQDCARDEEWCRKVVQSIHHTASDVEFPGDWLRYCAEAIKRTLASHLRQLLWSKLVFQRRQNPIKVIDELISDKYSCRQSNFILAFQEVQLAQHLYSMQSMEDELVSTLIIKAQEIDREDYVRVLIRFLVIQSASPLQMDNTFLARTFPCERHSDYELPECVNHSQALPLPSKFTSCLKHSITVGNLLRRLNVWNLLLGASPPKTLAVNESCRAAHEQMLAPVLSCLHHFAEVVYTGSLTFCDLAACSKKDRQILTTDGMLNLLDPFWRKSKLFSHEMQDVEALQEKLRFSVDAVEQLLEDEITLTTKLPALFPDTERRVVGKDLGKELYARYLKAIGISSEQVNGEDQLPNDVKHLQATIATVSRGNLATAGQAVRNCAILHAAVCDRHSALGSLWSEAWTACAQQHPCCSAAELFAFELGAREPSAQVALTPTATILKELEAAKQYFFSELRLLFGRGADSAPSNSEGLSGDELVRIERHWRDTPADGVAAALEAVRPLLADLEPGVANHLEAVLHGREAVGFWMGVNQCITCLCPDLPSGLTPEVEDQLSAVTAMHLAFSESRKGGEAGARARVTKEQLSKVQQAQRAMQTALGEHVLLPAKKLIEAILKPSGKAFLRRVLEFQRRGEDLGTRLAELMEGGLTHEQLEQIELANNLFQPVAVAVLSAKSKGMDTHNVACRLPEWPRSLWDAAHAARSGADIARVALETLQHICSRGDFVFVSNRMDSIHAALNQGNTMDHKLRENEDDATAVGNAIRGMMGNGTLQLVLLRSADGFSIRASYDHAREGSDAAQPVKLEEHRLLECSDKALLTVSRSTGAPECAAAPVAGGGPLMTSGDPGLTQEVVAVFTKCTELAVGLRQTLCELLQSGHPYIMACIRLPASIAGGSYQASSSREQIVEELAAFKFPQGEACKNADSKRNEQLCQRGCIMQQQLQDMLDWVRHANKVWSDSLHRARQAHAVMSLLPARNVFKVVLALLAQRHIDLERLLCTATAQKIGLRTADIKKSLLPRLEIAKRQSESMGPPADCCYDKLLSCVAEAFEPLVLAAKTDDMSEPLKTLARDFSKKRTPLDIATQESNRGDPVLNPARLLIVEEEEMPHSVAPQLQSTSTITLFSILLQSGVAPNLNNVLHCDGATTCDDVARFLHFLGHVSQASIHSTVAVAPVVGIFVHVDKLNLNVQQVLLSRIEALQRSCRPTLKLAATLTRFAKDEIKNDLSILGDFQKIKILKSDAVHRVLSKADSQKGDSSSSCVVTSELAGDGKTSFVQLHDRWSGAQSRARAVWGGAQSRGLAAKDLARAIAEISPFAMQGLPTSLHLELHSFQEGTGVDEDMLLFELLIFRCVYDPDDSTWARLPSGCYLFVEVANTLVMRRGSQSEKLLSLAAPTLRYFPRQHTVKGLERYSVSVVSNNELLSHSLSLAGSALLLAKLKSITPKLVCSTDVQDGVFTLTGHATNPLAATNRHFLLSDEILQEIGVKAEDALRRQGLQGRPCKATVMNFIRFLSYWVQRWGEHMFVMQCQADFQSDYRTSSKVPELFERLLYVMIDMAAQVSLRSVAADAQTQAAEDDSKPSAASMLQNAIAGRVRDISIGRATSWAFNAAGSLRFIGNQSDLPKELKQIWDRHNVNIKRLKRRTDGEDIFMLPPEVLDRASQSELQQLIVQVTRGGQRDSVEFKQRLAKAFEGYVLNHDNMIKIVDLVERIRAGLSSIFMGEAGCGKTFLVRMTSILLEARGLYEFQVHAGTLLEDLVAALDDAEAEASRVQEGQNSIVIIFFDELNTCLHLPQLKRLIVDRLHPVSHNPLHPALCLVAACNPWRKSETTASAIAAMGFSSPALAEDKLRGLAYRVHPLPESLFGCLSSFGQLDAKTEADYLSQMLAQGAEVLDADNHKLVPIVASTGGAADIRRYILGIAVQCVVAAHNHLRNNGFFVSLRDANRFNKIWLFIEWDLQMRSSKKPTWNPSDEIAAVNQPYVVSLVLALHLAYELRVPCLKARKALVAEMLSKTGLEEKLQSIHSKTRSGLLWWEGIVLEEEHYWLRAVGIPKNIAKVRPLRENVHAGLICFYTRTPIFILGKPGCSKSLSVERLMSALGNPVVPELSHLPGVSVQSYQGSRQSTSPSLLHVFKRAREVQKSLQKFKRAEQHPVLALVLLDEVGLAEQSPHNPLKVLHSELEPRNQEDSVPVLGISNWELDPSKMNRAMVLATPQADHGDLVTIAVTIIRFYLDNQALHLRPRLELLAASFEKVLANQQPRDFHGLRDWYGMCSYAARLLLAADSQTSPEKVKREEVQNGARALQLPQGIEQEAQELTRLMHNQGMDSVPAEWALHLAILSNFGGNRANQGFDTIKVMLDSLRANMGSHTYNMAVVTSLGQLRPVVDEPTYQLTSLLGDIDGRHIMVITSSPGPIIAWLEAKAREVANWETEVMVGSPLDFDQSSADMYAQSMLQTAIVTMAHHRRLLILCGLGIIYPALYDMFNNNYTRTGLADQGPRYCRVARANFCNPRCVVAEQFKAVVVVTPEALASYEPALLNRFACLEVEPADLLEAFGDCGEASWQKYARSCCRAFGAQAPVWRPTDAVPACPEHLLDMVAISSSIRKPGDRSSSREERMELLRPLIARELLDDVAAFQSTGRLSHDAELESSLAKDSAGVEAQSLPPWFSRSQPTFCGLLAAAQAAGKLQGGHVIHPLLVPTFSAHDQVEAQLRPTDVASVFCAISMARIPSQARLRDEMGRFLQNIMDKLMQPPRDESAPTILSALHVHINMRHDRARDIVDYVRVQIEWCAQELLRMLGEKQLAIDWQGVHVLALVVHGARGSLCANQTIRPFLLAGPSAALHSSCLSQWRAVQVDHFSDVLPWAVLSDILLKGGPAEILGLQQAGDKVGSDCFLHMLVEALPRLVPKFVTESNQSCRFAVLRGLGEALGRKPLLKDLFRRALASLLTRRRIDWRDKVAHDAELLRRAGPFQLALLSELRCDDEILPIVKAVWNHSLHTSCPDAQGETSEPAEADELIANRWWPQVAEVLLAASGVAVSDTAGLLDSSASVSAMLRHEPLTSQVQDLGMSSLKMPGSPAIFRIVLFESLRCAAGAESNSSLLSSIQDVLHHSAEILCLCQSQCYLALADVGAHISCGSIPALGLLGEDAVTEVAAEVCVLAGIWSGIDFFVRVRGFVHILVARTVMKMLSEDSVHSDGDNQAAYVRRALLPAACAVMLKPAAEKFACLERNCLATSPLRLESCSELISSQLSALDREASAVEISKAGIAAVLTSQAGLLLSEIRHMVEDAAAVVDAPMIAQIMQLAPWIDDIEPAWVLKAPDLLRVSIAGSILSLPCTDSVQASVVRILSQNEAPRSSLDDLILLIVADDIPLDLTLTGACQVLEKLASVNPVLVMDITKAASLLNSAMSRSELFPTLAIRTGLQKIAAFLAGKILEPVTGGSRQRAECPCVPVCIEVLRAFVEFVEHLPQTNASFLGEGPRADVSAAAAPLGNPATSLPSAYSCAMASVALEALERALQDFPPSLAAALSENNGCWDQPLVALLVDSFAAVSKLSMHLDSILLELRNERRGIQIQVWDVVVSDLEKACNCVVMHLSADRVSRKQGVPLRVQQILVLALARELVVVSVKILVDDAEDEKGYRRSPDHKKKLDAAIHQLLSVSWSGRPTTSTNPTVVHLTDLLTVAMLPLPLASLWSVVAITKQPDPVPSGLAFKILRALAAEIDLYGFLSSSMQQAISIDVANGLGLTALLPQATSGFVANPHRDALLHALRELGSEHCIEDAWTTICQELCSSFRGHVACLLAVGEVAVMQLSAPDDEDFEVAQRLVDQSRSLASLGKAVTLMIPREPLDELRKSMLNGKPTNSPFCWTVDLLPSLVVTESLWQASVLLHLLALLGSVSPGRPAPWGFRPFADFLDLQVSTLNGVFWPGLPDNEWHAWRYSGPHKHRLHAHVGVAECHCGFRYALGECVGPTSLQPCGNREAQCALLNGGTKHNFAAGQRLVAVPIKQANRYIWPECDIGCPNGSLPGLFALTEAEHMASDPSSMRLRQESRAGATESLATTTVRQLHPIAFRTLHLLVHASALLSAGMEEIAPPHRTQTLALLQEHLSKVAKLRPIKDVESVKWYLLACIEADWQALVRILGGSLEQAAVFLHAILHRLLEVADQHSPEGNLSTGTGAGAGALTSPGERVKFEAWFTTHVLEPVLGQQVGNMFPLPGVVALRSAASQRRDGLSVPLADLLARKAPPSTADWTRARPEVRAHLLPHVLRPSLPSPDEVIYDQLLGEGQDSLLVLKMVMAGPAERRGSSVQWPVDKDLSSATCLRLVLPFMRFVKAKEGGRITMDEARRQTIREWIDGLTVQADKEKAQQLYQLFECGWNAGCMPAEGAAMAFACGRVIIPTMSLDKPLASACPVAMPPPLGDTNQTSPELLAALVLHDLAVRHNSILVRAVAYLGGGRSTHIRTVLHPATICLGQGVEEGQISFHNKGSNQHEFRICRIQDAPDSQLLMLPRHNSCEQSKAADQLIEAKHFPDNGMQGLLRDHYCPPQAADCPCYGLVDLQAVENRLCATMFAGRQPLQVTSRDHTSMDADIIDFPYRIYHGNIDAQVLQALSRTVEQHNLLKALGSNRVNELKSQLYREGAAKAREAIRITGDIIPFLLGAQTEQLASLNLKASSTLREFVERITIGRASNHPDALDRIHRQDLAYIAAVPLSGLASLFLLARDLKALSEGVSVLAQDTGREFQGMQATPPGQALSGNLCRAEGTPLLMDVITRLLARCLYLSEDKPKENLLGLEIFAASGRQPPPTLQLEQQLQLMDLLGELDGLQRDPLSPALLHWSSTSYGHTVWAFGKFRQSWRNVCEPELLGERHQLFFNGKLNPAAGVDFVMQSVTREPASRVRQPGKRRILRTFAPQPLGTDEAQEEEGWTLLSLNACSRPLSSVDTGR